MVNDSVIEVFIVFVFVFVTVAACHVAVAVILNCLTMLNNYQLHELIINIYI